METPEETQNLQEANGQTDIEFEEQDVIMMMLGNASYHFFEMDDNKDELQA